MTTATDNVTEELRAQVRRRARARLNWYKHLAVYLAVNALLLGINLLATPGTIWFYWATLGWGIGLAAHWFSAFAVDARGPLFRRLESKELDRLQKERDNHNPLL